MKKNLFLLVLLFVSTLITSCKDDEKMPELIGDELNKVYYKGDLDIKLNNVTVGEDIPQKIYITKTGVNLIKMELNNFSFSGMPIGDIVVNNIAVIKTGNNHTFTGAEKITLPVSAEPCAVSVVGTIKGNVMEMKITVNVPVVGIVLVDFEGDKMLVNQSSEAKLTAFTIAAPDSIITTKPVIDGTDITFIVSDSTTPEQIKTFVPTITISENATISPASGVATDFTNAVVYTVTSEDGIYKTEYTVSIGGKSSIYSFDKWVDKSFISVKYKEVLPTDVFGSSNLGAAFLSLYGYKGGANVFKEESDIVSVNAAKLVTLDARSIANQLVPGIVSGSLFLGSFDVAFVSENRLKCSRFGIPFNGKPLSFKGSYKYSAGTDFVDASDHTNIVVVDGKKDECSIAAVLFEIEKDTDVLTGLDVNTSDKRVAVAVLADGTDKAEYTSFDIPFTYLDGKSFDPNKKYKITFVCSSSKEGDFFKGAPNSTLFIDEFEIVYEDVAPVE